MKICTLNTAVKINTYQTAHVLTDSHSTGSQHLSPSSLYSSCLNHRFNGPLLPLTEFFLNKGAADNRRPFELPALEWGRVGFFSSTSLHALSVLLDCQFFLLVCHADHLSQSLFSHCSCDANGHALMPDTLFRAGTLNCRHTQVTAASGGCKEDWRCFLLEKQETGFYI